MPTPLATGSGPQACRSSPAFDRRRCVARPLILSQRDTPRTSPPDAATQTYGLAFATCDSAPEAICSDGHPPMPSGPIRSTDAGSVLGVDTAGTVVLLTAAPGHGSAVVTPPRTRRNGKNGSCDLLPNGIASVKIALGKGGHP